MPPQDSFNSSPSGASPSSTESHDLVFQHQVRRLHRTIVYGRWTVVGLLWLTLAPLSLWGLRSEISLWRDHLTWAAVRYGLIYNRLSAIGLGICLGMTVAALVWHSRNLLLGLPQPYQAYLEKQVLQIRQQGKTHPLWKWVCGDQSN